MIAVIAQVATLLVGILGVFFSQGGEKNKVTRVGYLILALIILFGGIGVSVSQQDQVEKQRLTDSVQSLNGETENLTNDVITLATKDVDKFADMRLLFVRSPYVKIPDGYFGPIPIKVPGVTRVLVRLYQEQVFEINFEFKNVNEQIIAYQNGKDYPVACANSEDCLMRQFTPSWQADSLNDHQYHVALIPVSASGQKLLFTLAHYRSIGNIVIDHQGSNFDAKGYLSIMQHNFVIFLKIYGPQRNRGKDQPPCSALIGFPVGIWLVEDKANSSTFGIGTIGTLQYDPCENSQL